MAYRETYERLARLTDEALHAVLPTSADGRLLSAVSYALFGGGKRLRPVLYLAAVEAYGKPICGEDLTVACAIECIHTYSLIHDDLPAMDDDDFRRGQPTVHKKFDEATAVLAGDALLNFAYELLAKAASDNSAYVSVLRIISERAGMLGMVGGQATEFSADLSVADAELLTHITELKTGKLLEAALLAGCTAAGSGKDAPKWAAFADIFGRAFQLRDDLLDSSEKEFSLVRLWGKDKAARVLSDYEREARACLEALPCNTEFLKEFTAAVLTRTADGM